MKAQNSVYVIRQSEQQKKNLQAAASLFLVIPCAHFMFALTSQAQPLEISRIRIFTQSWAYPQVPKGPSAWNPPVSL